MKKIIFLLILKTACFAGTTPTYQPLFQQPIQTQRPFQSGITPTYQPNQIKSWQQPVIKPFEYNEPVKSQNYYRPDTGTMINKDKYVIRELKNHPTAQAIAIPKGEKIEPSPLLKKKEAWSTR